MPKPNWQSTKNNKIIFNDKISIKKLKLKILSPSKLNIFKLSKKIKLLDP